MTPHAERVSRACVTQHEREEGAVASPEEILEENRKVRRLQIVVNLVLNVLAQSDLPVEEASELVAQTRRFALDLFPDKELAYDLIYQPKFKRLMTEKYRLM
jgi:hypothetical protein